MIDPALMANLVYSFGYLGVFLVSLIGSATIIFPAPFFVVIFLAGSILNPFAVGLAAGFGAAIGELTGYGVGYGAEKIAEKRKLMKNKWFKRAQFYIKKRSMFAVILLFAATPLPFDVVGLLAGALRYDVRKFFFATVLGKIAKFLLIAYAGFYGIQIAESLLF